MFSLGSGSDGLISKATMYLCLASWIDEMYWVVGYSSILQIPACAGMTLRRVATFHHCVASSYLVVSYSARRE